MITEKFENRIYKCCDGERVLLTITKIDENTYRAVNSFSDITAEVIAIDDYRTSVKCIEYKKADKKGRYRKSTKLLDHTMSWLSHILQEKGIIRKAKCVG